MGNRSMNPALMIQAQYVELAVAIVTGRTNKSCSP